MTLFAALALPVPLSTQEQERESLATGTGNSVPVINGPLVPCAKQPGGAGFTLTVNGTGFVPGSQVKWNGSARATKFVSRSRLMANILTTDIMKPSTASVTVINPIPGGGASNVMFFEVTMPTSSASIGTSEFDVGSRPFSVATADFDGDGKLDLAVANNGSHNGSILLEQGDGTFKTAVNYSAGAAPRSVAVGDFNRDGKPDLAVANTDSNDVSVLLGKGDGTFNISLNVGVGLSPLSVVVGDFN